MSILSKYLRVHGHPIQAKLHVGKKDTLRASITDRYVVLTVTSPKRVTQEVYIPRTTVVKLLRWMIPLVKKMEGPDFYVPDAVQEYLRHEDLLRRDLKAQRGAGRAATRRSPRRKRRVQ